MQDRIDAEDGRFSTMRRSLKAGKIVRVPGSAVFLTRAKDQTPPVMAWHMKENRSLHEHVLALTLTRCRSLDRARRTGDR